MDACSDAKTMAPHSDFICPECSCEETVPHTIDAMNYRAGNMKHSRIRTTRRCCGCNKFATYRMCLTQNIKTMTKLDKKHFLQMEDRSMFSDEKWISKQIGEN